MHDLPVTDGLGRGERLGRWSEVVAPEAPGERRSDVAASAATVVGVRKDDTHDVDSVHDRQPNVG